MKRILLTRGKKAIVNDRDYRYLMQWKWYYLPSHRTGYAIRNCTGGGKHTTESMHRELAKRVGWDIVGKQIDHADRNGLNNRRGNLRVATRYQNGANQCAHRNNTTGFKGVTWHSSRKKWRARIRVNSRRLSLGLFDTKREAANAYDEAALKYFGPFAYLNPVLRAPTPTHRTTKDGQPAMQCGNQAKYVYKAGSKVSREAAKKKAIKQARAIQRRSGVPADL